MKLPLLKLLFVALVVSGWNLSAVRADGVSFGRDVRPILAGKCYKCHGPDENTREADLRLDLRSAATQDRGGYRAIVPEDLEKSEVITRITSDDEFLVMPPSDSNLQLTDEEIDVLKRWIEEGAVYEEHWAFKTPDLPAIPRTEPSEWPVNPIDHFVLRQMKEHGLEPAPQADRYSLLRRVYIDLTGLPPTIEEVDEFFNSTEADAYERLVDKLLNSPRYGEHWASHWLDLARYSDTNGYEKDRPRSIWPYRDWVINAINADLPFDQFTIEQLAGDMLDEPTQDQLIATGFHRNTMLNEEGGIDPLEYRYYAMVDRVATTGTVWLGMTIGCAQCHTHKYDPITHTDYYGMMGLLNNADEIDLIVPDEDVAARNERIRDQIAELESQLAAKFPPREGEEPEAQRRQEHLNQQFGQWLKEQSEVVRDWKILRPETMKTNLPRLEQLPDGSILSTGDITKRDEFELTFDLSTLNESGPITALKLEVLPDDRLPARGPGRAFYEGRKGDFFLSELTASRDGSALPLHQASHSFGKISVGSGSADASNLLDGNGSTGWSTSTGEGQRHELVINFKAPLESQGQLKIKMLFERHFAASLGRFRFSATTDPRPSVATDLPAHLADQLVAGEESLPEEVRSEFMQHFLNTTPLLAEERKAIDKLRSQLKDPTTTMIFTERPDDNPRPTFRHHRGEYLQSREEVAPHLPSLFMKEGSDAPENRLEFAQWLVSRENPLVGRVTVNRHWQAFFGQGLVTTSEDFGTQSSQPTHPDLLDWLANRFVTSSGAGEYALGWSRKELHRLIVTSATYRQSSIVDEEIRQRDPKNSWLSRGPRQRMRAEVIRDSMLQAAGILVEKVGGPSVYPPQPESVVKVAYGNPNWPVETGEDRYRRSLYTFSKRTAPFAAFTVFDAPSGENCIVRRDRSNTPLQALTMLNDAMYLEVAQKAARSLNVSEQEPAELVAILFRKFLTRPPTEEEVRAILEFRERQKLRFDSEELNVEEITGESESSVDEATWVMVARVLMNLDEAVTKP
ncbi:Planctomycete cytochrome C [Thalassoglobus neptunius]|uniref:Planctomycete cytochrome C n=1 Tax=Thalassoglobus neptunius TaxID=1938619 RepID=A0A5C5WX05_9PLAN|nr:PSD1 and planctomycete cytochrome C domain-containing protein [Thalassoglobus neptunius]TWT55247.1 Planctomycete cytochrome C [Thalassoglobus neptunius]